MNERIWPDGRGLAVSIVVNVEEGAQMSLADGDRRSDPVDELGIALGPGQPNFANESNYKYGLHDGFRRVAEVLDETATCATWTAAAVALERAPHIASFIAGRGDEVACHGLRWVHQYRMSLDEERAFIRKGTESIVTTCGQRPAGYLARYLTTLDTRRLLVENGYRYDMNDYSGDFPFWDATPAGPIVVLPYALDTNDMKMWTAPSYTPEAWQKYVLDTFDELAAEAAKRPAFMSLGVHLRIVGRPGRIGTFRAILRALKDRGAAVVRRSDIVERFTQLHPYEEAR